MQKQSIHLHLVSDSTGETVSSVSRAALAQFEGIEPEEHVWSLVRTPGQLEKVLDHIEENPGIVFYTMAQKHLRDQLKGGCKRIGVLCIPVLSRVIKDLQEYFGQKVSSSRPGKQHQMDEDYFERVNAINYALAHDDGQMTWELNDADVVVIGVSRTSKSPTSVYLAYRGYKAGNIPIVPQVPFPITPEDITRPVVVGLTISPERLIQIRKNRLLSLHEENDTDYVDMEAVREEIAHARKIFQQFRCPVIDVTRRSVEETVATIIQYIQERREGGGGVPSP
jgi:regulator of PEP synthase PpsR (kinase-PPPase family)